MNIIENHIIPEGVKRARLDSYAFETFDIFPSRKSVKKAIKRGEIMVDGENYEPFIRIKPGQTINLIESKKNSHRVYCLELRILYEDNWIAVIEKPPGLIVSGNKYKTLGNALIYNLKGSKQRDALINPRPVHRLDFPTGGLIIAAKTASSLVHLSRQFQKREIKKRYRAIVIGKLEREGTICYSLDNKQAETFFSSVKHYPSLKSNWLTIVDLWPTTGRYHQLRRHLSMHGYPILGDKLYGVEGKILKGKGLFLWSVEISLRHPIYEWQLTIKTREAQKFELFLNRELRRWKKYHDNEPQQVEP